MIKLDDQQKKKLLNLITREEDRKVIEQFFQELEEVQSDRASPMNKRVIAWKLLDIISRVGLEIGKHAAIDQLLHYVHHLLD